MRYVIFVWRNMRCSSIIGAKMNERKRCRSSITYLRRSCWTAHTRRKPSVCWLDGCRPCWHCRRSDLPSCSRWPNATSILSRRLYRRNIVKKKRKEREKKNELYYSTCAILLPHHEDTNASRLGQIWQHSVNNNWAARSLHASTECLPNILYKLNNTISNYLFNELCFIKCIPNIMLIESAIKAALFNLFPR